MEEKYGVAERIWVMDRGMVSEANIAFLRERRARLVASKDVLARDRRGGGDDVGGRDLAHLRGVLEDHAELRAEALLLLGGEVEAREARDVVDVDLDGHGRESSRGAARPRSRP